MEPKRAIWIGMFIGSSVGGMLPELWGAGYFSIASVFTTAIGGIVGIWIGYQLTH